jgi:hypothetical protein
VEGEASPAATGTAEHPPWIGGRRAQVDLRERGRRGGGGRGLGLEQAYILRGVRLNAFWPSDPIRRPVEEAHLFGPVCK